MASVILCTESETATSKIDMPDFEVQSAPYTYEYAFQESLKYFKGNDLPAKVFLDKYALRNSNQELLESTPDHMHRRIAKEFARIEKSKFKKPLTEDEIFAHLEGFRRIIPQGSPMYGIGNDFQIISLSNCYVLESPHDSYGGIHRTDEHLSQISKRRGGCGLDISGLRPDKSITHNAARTSTGIGPFMERYSNSIREVAQRGRRGALMTTISVHHPEVMLFAAIKRDSTKVTGSNISVRLTDEFLEAVDKDQEYEQRFPVDARDKGEEPSVSRMVSAREVWNTIIENAHAMAEPGLLFWDNIIRESPADCYAEQGFATCATNPSLHGDTLVLTKEGAYPIQFLAENRAYSTQVMNVRGEWCACHVFKSGENKRLHRITFTNGQTVLCTAEHKWPILNTSGNIINPQTGRVIKRRADELSRRDKIFFPDLDCPIDNPYSTFSRKDGFILGWNQRDGWITYHTVNKSEQFGFIFNKEDVDDGIGEEVLAYTNSLARIHSTLKPDHGCESAFTYCTTDSAVTSQLTSIGAERKSLGIPDTLWTGNSKFIEGYIDGLFSADGYVEAKEKLSRCRIVLVTAHYKMANDIRKLLSFYGIRSTIRTSRATSKFPNVKYNSSKLYERHDLQISGMNAFKFASKFSLTNSRKNRLLQEIAGKDVSTYFNKNRKHYANNRQYLVVQSVVATEEFDDVYDISVDDDTHTFMMETGITGNCSEIPLSAFDSCRLLLLNLFGYVTNPFTKDAQFDFEAFGKDVRIAQRLMDDLIDLEAEKISAIIAKIKNDPEPESIKRVERELWENIKKACLNGRRTGLGITALGDTIAALGVKYASPKGIELTDKIYRELKLKAYASSVEMAKELGAFPVWDHELEKDCPFLLRIQDEDEKLWKDMKKWGRRNIALLTTAPAGTVSILARVVDRFGTSSGIEPEFSIEPYTRRKKGNPGDSNFRSDFVDPSGDHWQEFKVYPSAVLDWMDITGKDDATKSPWHGCCAEDLNWTQRVKSQAAAQRHIDHAISSTLNLPEDVTPQRVAEIYEAAWKAGCKGITVYRDNCRTGVLISDKKEDDILKTTAPKRPKDLMSEMHFATVKGEHYFVVVGLLKENEPYEVFVGNNGFVSKKGPLRGSVRKEKRRFYHGSFESDIELRNISSHCSDEEESLTRMVSTALRHGADVEFVVHQLEKARGDLSSPSKAIARVLKKFIADGTKISGDQCPSCKSPELERNSGCATCRNCGYSGCS